MDCHCQRRIIIWNAVDLFVLLHMYDVCLLIYIYIITKKFDHLHHWKLFFNYVSENDNTRVTLQDATQKSFFVECDDQFELLLDELGIREVIGEDDEALRTMWNNLKVRE